MTELKISRKLAEAMGYELDGRSFDDVIGVYKNASNRVPRYFRPHRDMSDAWEVAERFGLDSISRNATEDTWTAAFDTDGGLIVQTEKTAPLAICFAALKVIDHGS